MAVSAVLAGADRERTLFKDIPATDPEREVIEAVLGSRFHSMRDGFTAREWAGGGYGAAWERARRYFPGNAFLVRPGTFFMTHGFDSSRRLFIEVHESAYLTLCADNRRTFAPASIVEAYGLMLTASGGRKAAGFRDKTGRLEPSFRDERAHRGLRKSVGEALYLRLLRQLREEDYHMLAGGLMHEGMHAGMDDALVARVQDEFEAGERAVQWDELRAFMAEIGYHAAYSRWASGDIRGSWERVGALLGSLEPLRKRPALRSPADQARLEERRTAVWVHAALIRLRMREIWQSARRARDLVEGFRRDYVKGTPPDDVAELYAKLDGDTAGFAAGSAEAIQASELVIRFLEEVLDEWTDWADGRRPFPPPITDSTAVMKRSGGVRWPDPDAAAAAALMKRAGQALEAERAPW